MAETDTPPPRVTAAATLGPANATATAGSRLGYVSELQSSATSFFG
jgi:hypothetical protein